MLSKEKCEACSSNARPLIDIEIEPLLEQLDGWSMKEIDGEKRIVKTFTFDNFRGALEFTKKVGEAAETENHHPLIITEWGKTTVHWWTHKIGGLHRNDFIMAAKTDDLY